MRRNSYAGYGIPDPVPAIEAGKGPVRSIKEALQAAQEALEDTLFEVDLVGWRAPPFRSQCWYDTRRTVLNIGAAVNAGANAGGLALVAANSTIAPLNPLVQTTTAAGQQFFDLWRIKVTESTVVVVDSWGITCVNAPPEALATRLRGTSVGGFGSPPKPASSGNAADQLQPTHHVVTGNKEFAVQIGNVVDTMALFVEFAVYYWQFPVTRTTDEKKKMKLKPGFGAEDCK